MKEKRKSRVRGCQIKKINQREKREKDSERIDKNPKKGESTFSYIEETLD